MGYPFTVRFTPVIYGYVVEIVITLVTSELYYQLPNLEIQKRSTVVGIG